MNRMLDPLGFDAALKKADFPQPGRNRGERPAQLITPVFAFGMGAPIDLSMERVSFLPKFYLPIDVTFGR